MNTTFAETLASKFVREYYTKQNSQPDSLIELYAPKAQVLHGVERRDPRSAKGTAEIEALLVRQGFGKSKIFISDVNLLTVNSKILSLTVIGEQKFDTKRPQKFVQNFALQIEDDRENLKIVNDTLKFLVTRKPQESFKSKEEVKDSKEVGGNETQEAVSTKASEPSSGASAGSAGASAGGAVSGASGSAGSASGSAGSASSSSGSTVNDNANVSRSSGSTTSGNVSTVPAETEKKDTEKHEISAKEKFARKFKEASVKEFVPAFANGGRAFAPVMPMQVPMPYPYGMPPSYPYTPIPVKISAYMKLSSHEITQVQVMDTLVEYGKTANLHLEPEMKRGFVEFLDTQAYQHLVGVGPVPIKNHPEYTITIKPRT